MRLNVGDRVLEGVKLVIFDKDGTLTDLYTYWSWMAHERALVITERLALEKSYVPKLQEVMGLDLGNRRFKPDGPIGVKKRSEVLKTVIEYLEGCGVSDPTPACEFAFAETDRRTGGKLGELIRLLPGASRLLENLAGKCKVAIATSDNTERAKIITRHLGIEVDLIVGGDAVSNGKPHPEPVEMILRVLKVNPKGAVLIGDSSADMMCARNSGLLAGIAVCTGIESRKELSVITEYVAGDLTDIVASGEMN